MREKYIARMARRYGLDPAAVLANAAGEGLSGGVGDGGHAFGPFQMNDAGGVLTNDPNPQHHTNAYAWSNAGINRALRAMATVAKGLHGEAAVRAIVTRYERPADTSGAISARLGYLSRYQRMVGGGNLPNQGLGGADSAHRGAVPAGGGKVFDQATYQKQAATMMLQDAVARAHGQDPNVDPTTGQPQGSILDRMVALRQANTVQAPKGPLKQGGPGKLTGGSDAGSRLVQEASKQLGQPYVWGGESRKEGGFDCSGLVQWAGSAMGVNLPRTTGELMKTGHRVPLGKIKKGDLLVNNEHVVIYAGNGKVIAAPHTGTNVQWQDASAFLGGDYQARRVVG